MLQNMTVRHVGSDPARRVRKPHQNLADAAGRDRGDVLPAGALGFRRLAIPQDDAELTAVDVTGCNIRSFPSEIRQRRSWLRAAAKSILSIEKGFPFTPLAESWSACESTGSFTMSAAGPGSK